MKILITGGAGFLGTNIAYEAIKLGYEVIIMDNFVRRGSERNAALLEKLFGNAVKVVHGEVRLKQDWDSLPKIDAIIHLAGQPGIPASLENPEMDFYVNAIGTLNGLIHARSLGIPFLYASTNKIYSDVINGIRLGESEKRYYFDREDFVLGVSDKGVTEHFPMDSAGEHPHSPYGVSKAAGDLLTQEFFHAFGVPTVVFRMSCIYGLYQNGVSEQGWTDFFVRQRILGNNKLTFYGNGKQVRDCLFGSDAASAYLMALKQINKAAGKVYNLGGGEFNSSLIEWVDILNIYRTAVGDHQPMEIEYADWRLADHRVYISDTSKIEKDLGWKPVIGIEKGIEKMVDAYRGDFYKI